MDTSTRDHSTPGVPTTAYPWPPPAPPTGQASPWPPPAPPTGRAFPWPPPPDGPGERPSRLRSALTSRTTAGAAAIALLGAVAGAGITRAVWPSGRSAAASSAPLPGTGNAAGPLPGNLFPGGSGGGGDDIPDGAGSAGNGSGTAGQGAPSDAAAIAAKVDPAVVDIDTTLGYQGARAAGTGIVLTSHGEILTNNHVISGATSIRVTDVGNGQTYTATVVGYDRSDDIAVLQLKGASGLATATTASIPAATGDAVVGIGNAGGSGGTPSYAGGSITATNQSITASDSSDGTSEQLTGLLETNAAIVAGDSGGPLVNTRGEVVGIDTAASAGFRFSSDAAGYAIPIATALRIARQIESATGSATVHIGATAMLGVEVQSAQDRFATSGAVIAGVLAGGPAATAGLVAGDVITAVNGHATASPDELSAVMLTLTPGHTARVTYLDPAGQQRTVKVRLGTGPAQ